MKETKTSTLKAKFRASKLWKDFRKKVMNAFDNKDPITGRKLVKGFNLHHRRLTNDMEVYRDISDVDMFRPFNPATHDAVHWGLNLVKHNGLIALARYVAELLQESELNGYITREELEEFLK